MSKKELRVKIEWNKLIPIIIGLCFGLTIGTIILVGVLK